MRLSLCRLGRLRTRRRLHTGRRRIVVAWMLLTSREGHLVLARLRHLGLLKLGRVDIRLRWQTRHGKLALKLIRMGHRMTGKHTGTTCGGKDIVGRLHGLNGAEKLSAVGRQSRGLPCESSGLPCKMRWMPGLHGGHIATENWLPHRTKRHGRLQLAGGTGGRCGN